MVAVVVGSRLGLEQTSAWVLGARGQLGSASLGRAGENVFVNAATGNLVVTNRDEFLIGQGGDALISRTYNSLGALDGDNDDGWTGVATQVYGLSGAVNTPGTFVYRRDWHGAEVAYSWDAARSAYVSKEGGGAFDTITFAGGVWRWADGDTGVVETYDPNQINKIGTSRDRDGNTTTYSYNGAGQVSRITTQDGSYTDLTWSGTNLTQVTTTYYDGQSSSWKSLTRVRYAYDGSNRLTTVTVDLSPEDNSVADGKTYVTTYTYDGASKRIASISQTDGARIDIVYETGGAFRVASISQAVAAGVTRTTSFNYVSITRTDVTDADGQTTRLEYDYLGQLVKIAEPAATAAAAYQVREFTYTADGDLSRIKTGPDSWTFFFYPPGGSAGVWTSRYERTGGAGYITTQRTYNAANSVLTETRYETLDLDYGGAAYQPSGAMTTRYTYDSENHLRFVVSPTGAVTRYDYATNGNLIRSTAFTGARYNLAGLAIGEPIAETSLDAWAAGLTDKTAAQITETVYDFRGNVAQTIAYSTVLANGGADAAAPATRTNYVYDQAGKLLSRYVTGLSNAETFIYDGLGRMVSAVDFNGATTRTVFHDVLGTTVIQMADGLNKVSVYNKAGEVVSYSESERGANLVNLQGWPEYDPNLPAGPGSQPAWHNWYSQETRWQTTIGPDGQPVTAMQAGQLSTDQNGGGSHTNPVMIDASKTYEFVYYFKKSDLTAHSVYFGLAGGSPAYVEAASGSGPNQNPYFFAASPGAQQAPFQQDKWYKVVGYVLPEGAANISNADMGGVYDVETGQKMAVVNNFRWSASRPNDVVYSRYFDFYNETELGFSTYFYKPEMRRTDQPSVNLINLSGWPGSAGPPTGPAVVEGWTNYYVTETRWHVADGPDGRKIVAIQAGQFDANQAGGGNVTNNVPIDGSKAYEFTLYVRKEDLTKHSLYFGLTAGGDTPYVDYAAGHGANGNPYFYGSPPAVQQATLVEDRWYKIVGYVLPQGSADVPQGALGGVFDTTTGVKVADVNNFRWRADRPGNAVHARFFDFYDHTQTGWSTSFYKPEIREVSTSAVEALLPAPATQYRYDKMGRLRMATDPTGRSTHYLFDNVGRKVGEVDADGSLTEYKYDLADRLVATVRYATRLTAADIASLTDGMGNPAPTDVLWIRPAASADDAWSWNVYDSAGRLLQIIDGAGGSTAYEYDGSSRLVKTTARANTFTASQVAAFKLTSPAVVQSPGDSSSDRVTRYFFDADGRQIGTLDAEGNLSRIIYDAAGRVVQTSAFANGTAQVLRAAGTFQNLYDSFSKDSAVDVHTWSVYDGRGFLKGSVNGEGEVTLYDHTALGHVSQIQTGRKLASILFSQPTLAQLVAAPASPVLETTTYTRNPLGQVLTETRVLASGSEVITYTYDSLHRLTGQSVNRVTGPDYGIRQRHDRRGRLIGQLSGEGSAALAALGASPTKAQVDAVYRKWGTTFTYDAADRLVSRTDPDGVDGPGFTTTYFYDTDGALAYEVNSLGEVRGYVYDALNRRTQSIAFGTRIATAGLKGGDIVGGLPSRTSITGADSRTIIAYNVTGTVAAGTDALGASTLYNYNAFGELANRHDPFGPTTGTVTTFAYDRRGLTTQTVQDSGGLNRTQTLAYDAYGRVSSMIDARGYARTTSYDRAGRVKVSRDAFNNQTTYAYDARGHVLTTTDRLGKTTSFSHDAFSRQVTMTTAEGLVTTTTFDDRGHTLAVTDGAGRATSYVYDLDGQLKTVANGLGQQDLKTYDTAGRLYETTDASGVKVRYGYDGAGRVLTETVDPTGLNLVTTYVYDAKGQQIRVTDPAGVRTDYVFDAAGQTAEVIIDPAGLALRTVFTRDRAGNITKLREAAGTTAERDTIYQYDQLGRLTYQQTGDVSLNIRSAYDYDANGNVVRRRDGVSTSVDVATRYVYDAENRLILTVDPTGAVTRNQYDVEGRIVRTTGYANPVSLPDTALTEAQVMGALGSSPSRQTDYVYDDDGRLVFTRNAAGQVTELAYDGSGEVVRRTDYANVYVTGALPTETELRGWLAVHGSASDRTSLAAYDAAGRQTWVIDAAGQVTAFAYDGAGRVIRTRQHAVLNTANGVMTHATLEGWAAANAHALDRVTRTAYDAAGRAAFVIDAQGYVSRTTYDAAGKIASQSRFTPVVSVSDGVSATTVASLIAAHETTAATTTYSYDAAGRHDRTVDAGGVETRLTLDGMGRTTQVGEAYGTADERFTNRHYDDGGRLVAEVVAPGQAEQVVRKWDYDGLGRVVNALDGVAFDRWLNGLDSYVTSYTYDAMGRVLTVTAPLSSGQLAVTTNTYDTFGNLVKVVDPRGHAGFFYYNILNQMDLQVDPEGYATQTAYSRGGEVTSVVRRAARVSGTPTIATRPTIVTGAGDAVTTVVRDKLDRVVATVDGEGHAESYQLNAFGDRTRVTNKLGGHTDYTYDKRGLMISELLPITSLQANGVAGNVVNLFEYDARGNLTRTIEAATLGEARTTNYVYDRLNRLVSKTSDAVTVTSSATFATSTVTPTETIVYDKRGNVIETVNAGGARTLFYYDDNNRKVAEIDASGALRKWTYDANGNAVSARAYDTAVALPSAPGGTPPAGSGAYRETLNTYDRNNRLTGTTVAGLRVGEYGAGYATSIADVVVQNVYDRAGNLVQVIDGRGVSSFAFYDALGRQTATVDGEGYLTTFVRDAEGNVTREVRYAIKVVGAVTTARDPATLAPRTASAALGDRITDFTYDANGRRLTEIRRGVQIYSAGATDRLATVDAQITYLYDGLGNVVKKTEANGDFVDYGYDLIGRQTSELDSAFTDYLGASVRRQTTTAYNGWSGVTRVQEGKQGGLVADARVTTFAYAGGRLSSMTDATGFTRHFGYDAAGRVTKESYDRVRGDGVTVTEGRRYAYDALGRLTSESAASTNGTWSFGDTRSSAYNTHGELIERRLNGVLQESFAYDAGGRMWRSTGGDGVYRYFLYDKAGRATLVVAPGSDFGIHAAQDVEGLLGVLTDNGDHAVGEWGVSFASLTFNLYDNRGLATGTREPLRQLGRDLQTLSYTTATIVRSRALNAFGEVISETDARGFTTDFTYNTMGRIIEQRSPEVAFTNEQGVVANARPTEQRRYDVSGRLVATRTANGHWTSRTLLAGSGHEGEEAIVTSELFPDQGTRTYGVDVFGDVRKITNQLGFVTLQNYDKAGRLISVQHPGRAANTPGNSTASLVQLTDFYAWDGLGQRIQHWNSQFGTGYKEKTVYDREGRVVSQTDFENRATTYNYVWDAGLTTAGMGANGGLATFGGWIKTTTHASGKTGIEKLDGFGRLTGRTDLGGRIYAMGYDAAGRLVSQTSGLAGSGLATGAQSLTWSWYNTGLLAEQKDISGALLGYSTATTQANYNYDAAGNRVRERYLTTETIYIYDPYAPWDPYSGYTPPTPVQTSTIRQDSLAAYDALGRMTQLSDTAAGAITINWKYDLNSNVRNVHATYPYPVGTSQGTQNAWYRYDAMDRMVHVEGRLQAGQITGGTDISYDAAGNRATTLRHQSAQYWTGEYEIDEFSGKPRRIMEFYSQGVLETYRYTADGYLADVSVAYGGWAGQADGHYVPPSGPGTVLARDTRDAMGRLTFHEELYGGVTVMYSNATTYDRASVVTQEVARTRRTDTNFGNYYTVGTTYFDHRLETTPGSGLWTGAWQGVVTRARTITTYQEDNATNQVPTTPVKPTQTTYQYVWHDGARQAKITYDNDTTTTSNVPYTSTFAYDVNGKLTYVNIKDGRPRNVTYVTDSQGQVLRRTELDNISTQADPWNRYLYFDGVRVGELTNDGVGQTNYVAAVANRNRVNTSPFQSGGQYAEAEFGSAYEALTPDSVRGAGTTWTVRDGDTLMGIAEAAWGDASLWYMIAEANGLSSASLLTAGQTLTIPAKVANVHNTSETFRPYDPNKALGNVNPTQPKPPPAAAKAKGCGGIGQVIMVVIAVAVAALVLGPAVTAATNFFAGGATAGAAATAAGSAAAVAGTVAGGAIAGAAGSIASQAFGVATGIQDKFDWKGVALSALSGAVGGGMKFTALGGVKGAAGGFVRGAASSVVTQGVAVATGLQDEFNWTSVAVSAVSAGVGEAVGSKLTHLTYEQAGFVSGLAGGVAGAATQSIIDGTSFGDNLIATLPSVIGQTIGNMVAGEIHRRTAEQHHDEARSRGVNITSSRATPIETRNNLGALSGSTNIGLGSVLDDGSSPISAALDSGLDSDGSFTLGGAPIEGAEAVYAERRLRTTAVRVDAQARKHLVGGYGMDLFVVGEEGTRLRLHVLTEPNKLLYQLELAETGARSATFDPLEGGYSWKDQDIHVYVDRYSRGAGLSRYFNMNSGFQAGHGINSPQELEFAQTEFKYNLIMANPVTRWVYEHPRALAALNLAGDFAMGAEGVVLMAAGAFGGRAPIVNGGLIGGGAFLTGLAVNNGEANLHMLRTGEYRPTLLNRMIQNGGLSEADAHLAETGLNLLAAPVSVFGATTALGRRAPGTITRGEVQPAGPFRVVDDMPEPHSLTNAETRAWYNVHVKGIDLSGPLTRANAERVSTARARIRVQARELMADREAATILGRDYPIRSFDHYVEKYRGEGYRGENLWRRIIHGAESTNKKVNERYGG